MSDLLKMCDSRFILSLMNKASSFLLQLMDWSAYLIPLEILTTMII